MLVHDALRVLSSHNIYVMSNSILSDRKVGLICLTALIVKANTTSESWEATRKELITALGYKENEVRDNFFYDELAYLNAIGLLDYRKDKGECTYMPIVGLDFSAVRIIDAALNAENPFKKRILQSPMDYINPEDLDEDEDLVNTRFALISFNDDVGYLPNCTFDISYAESDQRYGYQLKAQWLESHRVNRLPDNIEVINKHNFFEAINENFMQVHHMIAQEGVPTVPYKSLPEIYWHEATQPSARESLITDLLLKEKREEKIIKDTSIKIKRDNVPELKDPGTRTVTLSVDTTNVLETTNVSASTDNTAIEVGPDHTCAATLAEPVQLESSKDDVIVSHIKAVVNSNDLDAVTKLLCVRSISLYTLERPDLV